MSPSEEYASLIIPCDCEEETCATRLELTPDGILIIEDADGEHLSLLLPDWLESVLRTALTVHARETNVSDMMAPTNQTAWPTPTVDQPDLEALEEWMNEGVCETTDGCFCEPDGVCVHGYPSWLLDLGLI